MTDRCLQDRFEPGERRAIATLAAAIKDAGKEGT